MYLQDLKLSLKGFAIRLNMYVKMMIDSVIISRLNLQVVTAPKFVKYVEPQNIDIVPPNAKVQINKRIKL